MYKENFLNDIKRRLQNIYGDEYTDDLYEGLLSVLDKYSAHLKSLSHKQQWDQSDIALISYADNIQSPGQMPLDTMTTFLKQRLDDVFTIIHLLLFFPSSSDGGFSVVDYRAVDPEIGNWQHLESLSKDYDLIFDLVLNYSYRHSLWFSGFIENTLPGKDFFIEVETDANLSRVVRPRSTPLLTDVRTHRGIKYVWATFSDDQIDRNFKNPKVLYEFIDILMFYLKKGARAVRLDAVHIYGKNSVRNVFISNILMKSSNFFVRL